MIKCLMLLSLSLPLINAYNILVVAPVPLVGHWLYVEEFIKELLERGHKVEAIVNYSVRRGHENYTGTTVPLFNVNDHCE